MQTINFTPEQLVFLQRFTNRDKFFPQLLPNTCHCSKCLKSNAPYPVNYEEGIKNKHTKKTLRKTLVYYTLLHPNLYKQFTPAHNKVFTGAKADIQAQQIVLMFNLLTLLKNQKFAASFFAPDDLL